MSNPEQLRDDSEQREDVSVKKIAATVLDIKRSSGMQKMQGWFDALSPANQERLMRANDIMEVRKIIERYVPNLNVGVLPWELLKNMTIFAASFGLLDVRQELIEKSRGISGIGIYGIPDGAAKAACKYLGAPPGVYAIWKLGKEAHAMHQSVAPKVRAELAKAA